MSGDPVRKAPAEVRRMGLTASKNATQRMQETGSAAWPKCRVGPFLQVVSADSPGFPLPVAVWQAPYLSSVTIL